MGTTNLDTLTLGGDLNVTGNVTVGGAEIVNNTLTADITMATNKKVEFRDTAAYINSGSSGALTIHAATVDVNGVASLATGTGATAGGAVATSLGTAGVLGVYFGSGAPSVVAPKGSLYLRTDGSTTNDRAYIARDGAGTWTALTTAA